MIFIHLKTWLRPVIRRLPLAVVLSVGCVLGAFTAHSSESEVKPVFSLDPAFTLVPNILPGAAIGEIAEGLMVAGGVYDDDTLSRRVFLVELPGGNVRELGELDQGLRLAGSVVMDNRFILVGGMTQDGPTDMVISLEWDADLQRLDQVALPSLPLPLAGSGVSLMNGMIYVVGGLHGTLPLSASSDLFRLNIAIPASRWESLESLPGSGRMMPSLLSFFDQLFVFGGWGFEGEELRPLEDAWAFRRIPLDGTVRTGWRKLADPPGPVSGAIPYVSGQQHAILIGGGVSKPLGFAEAPGAETESGSSVIRVYHTVTDKWVGGGELPDPIAGGLIVKKDDQHFLLGINISDGATLWNATLNRTVKRLSVIDYAVMFVYLMLMAWIGFHFARKQNTSDEYALGNRKVKSWAAGVSMFATLASSISFMAIPALTFRTNLVWLFPTFFLIPIFFLLAYVIYPLLRRLAMTSTYEYLERRYNPILRLLASMQSIFFQVFGRMAVVLLLPALAISAVTGIDVGMSVLIMGLLTTLYTTFGGFEAVIWTDVCQGLLMLGGALLMVVMAITALPGGFGEFVEVNMAFNRFDSMIFSWDYTVPAIWIALLFVLTQELSKVADQPAIQRLYSTPENEIKRFTGVFTFFAIGIAVAVNLVGLALFAYFHAFPAQLDPSMTNDQVIPLYIVQRLPVGVAGLIIAALFAASMSTLSSSMNSAATLITEDFFRRAVPSSSDRTRLIWMKSSAFVVGMIGTGSAFYMAQMEIESMFQIWSKILALFGGGFVGMYLLGMFTVRATSLGAAAGALGSIAVVIYIQNWTHVHWMFYSSVAVISCLLIGYGVSFIPATRERDLTGLTIHKLPPKGKSVPG